MARDNRWPPRDLEILEKQLDALSVAVRDGAAGGEDKSAERDVDDQIWLTRFLVIRTCGYLEQVVHQTMVEHIWRSSGGKVRTFALSHLSRSKNPSPDYMYSLVAKLDQGLRDDLESLLEARNGHLKEQISQLVGRRNAIAHGHNDGMGDHKALKLVADAKEVAAWFIRNLEPNRRV